jgi:HSP20 family molecular chaperone IbpA
MDVERKYDNPYPNTANNKQVTATGAGGNSDISSSSGAGAGAGTVARPRSFWDLSSFPSWSDLTPQQIKLDWSGTDSSSKEYVVSATLPAGMSPGDVTISVDERSRLMTLKCQTKSHDEEKDKDGHVISSRSSSSFSQRSIQLPRDVDLSAISASKNTNTQVGAGPAQLLLHLPKLAHPAPEPGVKRIAIQ